VAPVKRKRRLEPVILSTAIALGGMAAFLLVAGGSDPARSTASALAAIESMLDAAGHGLTQVSLTGHRLTPDGDLLDAIDLASSPTMLSFNSRAVQARIEALAWVERASIERIFPDRIEVRITERVPFAVWRNGGRHYLIDRKGRVLSAVAADTAAALPRVAGEGAAAEAAALYALLEDYPDLARRVELAERIGERRWTLRLAGGGIVQLPEEGVARALARAAALAGSTHEAGAGEIDLRVAGRILVRGRQSAPAEAVEQVQGAALATGGI
jgi:cell division protein FtsQ